jgi:hypothetical protein
VASGEAAQLSETEEAPAVAFRAAGAAGSELAPEELELLLDELDEDELEELDEDELEELEDELLELEELDDEPVPLEPPPPPPDELEDDELEDDELDEMLFGVAEASLDSTLVPAVFTAATL